ncbi:MAG: chromosome segregation protein SMC [Chloroflexota bacterium]
MTAPARLLGLKLHGFKSFAERTSIEFGPGISAIVGPNGSGKSNLADALRWALGEQGRALRLRKAEDVIWAGSERRAAQGMADVTLVVDNADGLIPVEFQVLELGRRLYRSGENDYLLNRQRVRLRDLVDLLDSAHLADNAFLFIGQGMVDQALALRPEERRPLFEEVAGVRRHERRRRRAEEQLLEAETNLARVQDIVAELRPQVRRLAAQAEQQTTRRSAGEELSEALIAAAHVRWHAAAARAAGAEADQARARSAVDTALAEQTGAEAAAGAIAARLEARAAREVELAGAHEASRSTVVALQLRDAGLAAEEAALERDRGRLADERRAAEAERDDARRSLTAPDPHRDRELEAALAEAERMLADTLAQLADLRAGRRARGEELAALRRADAARTADIETARRRVLDAERRLDEEGQRLASLAERRTDAAGRAAAATDDLARALADEVDAIAARDLARTAVERGEGTHRAAMDRLAAASQAQAGLGGRLEALERRISADAERGIAPAARRRGGRLVNADLLVDASVRGAVEVALSGARRAYVVLRRAVSELAGEQGALIVEELAAAPPPKEGAADRHVRERVVALGGGFLEDAVRRDASGAVRRLLRRAAWLPDLERCLEIQPDLAPGWIAVARDGSAVVSEISVALGKPEGTLDWKVEADRLRSEGARLEEAVGSARAESEASDRALGVSRASLVEATSRERSTGGARRAAEELERRVARDLEAIEREVGWHQAQVTRLEADLARLRSAIPVDEGSPGEAVAAGAGDASPDAEATDPAATDPSATASWEARVAELRARRDALAADVAVQDQAIRAALDRRSRAEATVASGDNRVERADHESAGLTTRANDLAIERQEIRGNLADVAPRAEHARAALDELRAEDRRDREQLATAEGAAATARDQLRASEDRARAADRLDLEARLALDALREQVLVELAGLGELGLRHLEAVGRRSGPADTSGGQGAPGAAGASRDVGLPDVDAQVDEGDPDVVALEAALDAAAHVWADALPVGDMPTPGRLAGLRRRYHELGAANPYAIDEYDSLRSRLQGLDEQEGDLRAAIVRTRDLIGELNTLIATQFRTTFASLEVAFDARFRQLFGGGFARLSLTDPEDLSATGVEIVARPPGKKAQALSMLSGGERALTAVALLFAMLTVRPVPFCVLDEVDAALDEANVGRFAEALHELAARIQFIVITHNRGTIEQADALYGVTVGDDSVSRVVSLRLDEANAIAAQATSDPRAGQLDPESVVG